MADIFDTLDEVKTEQKRDIFDEIGDVAPEAHHALPDPNVTTTVTPGPFNLPSPEQPSARVPITVGPEAQDAILAERSKGPTTKQFVNEVIPEAIADTAGSVMGAVAKPFTHYAGSTLTKVTEKIPGVPFAKGVIANKFPGGKYAIGAIEGAQDIADSFLSPLGVATLGMGMLPKAGQKVLSLAFAVDMARNLPEQARQLKVAIDSGDQVAIAKAMVGLAGNATFSALAAKHGLSVDPSGKVSLQQGSDLTQAAAERAQQNIAPIENRIAIDKAAQDAAAGRSPEAGPDIMRDFGQRRAMVPAATIPETLLPIATAEAAKQTKKAEVPNASSKQTTAAVYGGVRALPGEGAGQVPVAQGQRGILAQAPGRVPEGGEAAPAGTQPEPHAVGTATAPIHYIGGALPENLRLPIFTTSSKEGASWYADQRGEGGKVHEINIESKNPFSLFNESDVQKLLPILDEVGVKYKYSPSTKEHGWFLEVPEVSNHSPYSGENPLDVSYIPAVRDALIKRGYDSIKANDQLESGEIPVTVLIRHPEQLKRAPSAPVEAAKPPEVEGVTFNKVADLGVGGKRWVFDIKINDMNASFSLPAGADAATIRARADAIRKQFQTGETPMTADEAMAAKPGTVTHEDISGMADSEVSRLMTERDKEGNLRFRPHEQGVRFGMTQPPSVILKLVEMAKAERKRADAATEAGDNATSQGAQGKATFLEGAVQGARKEGPNYDAVLEEDAAKQAQTPLKIGDAAKLMGFDTVLAKSETHGGVRYELFNGARLKDRRAVIRVTDVDSGKVVTLKQHGNYNAAEKEFNTSVKAAAKAAAPPPAPAFKRTKTTLESKVTDFIKGSIGLIRNKKYGKPGSEGDYGSAYKAAIERHGTGLFGKNGRPPNEVVDDLRRAGLLGENATVDDLWDVINAEYDTQTKHRQGLTPEAQADKFYEAVDKNLKRKDAQPVSIGEMGIGAKFKLNGQEFEITHIDPDTGEVTAKDGTKFGSQQIPDGADIPVDKGTFKPAEEEPFVAETKPEEPKKPDLTLEPAETVEQQNARLAQEKAAADAKKIAENQAEAARQQQQGKIGGNLGEAGQGELLGGAPQGEMFKAGQGKIFTNEEAAAAAERLKNLFRPKAGIRPEVPDYGQIITDLISVVGNVAERGAYKFADLVAEMVKQFGEDVRPYLKPAYERLRQDPKSESFRDKMSTPEEVGTISEPPEGGPPEPGKPEAPKPGGIPESGTGIQNAAVDAAKVARGEEPLMAPARLANQKVWDDAMARIDADPAWQDRLINELRDNPRTLTPEETIAMDQRYVTMQEKYAQTARELADAYDDPMKVEAIPELEARLAAQSDALLDFEKITQDVGTEWGRSGQIRQRLLKEDYTLARMTVLKRAANGGRPLTDAEMEEVGRLNEKIAGLQKQHDEYVQKHEERMSELQAKHAIEMLKREAAPVDPVIKRIVDRIGTILKDQRTMAMERLNKRLREGRTSLDPAALLDYAIIGASHLFEGALDIGKFTAKMVADFGEDIRPDMPEIFKAANEHFDAMIDQAAGKRAPAVRKAAKTDSPKEKIEAAKESIREKVKTSDQPDISRAVQKLARSLVEDGVSDMHALIDEVHKFLQEIDPEITRREAMDAISGYGKYKQLSKDEVSTQLRDLKGQMQQVAKLLDLFERRPPQKTGMERRTPTDEERRWLQQVNEAKKRFGVQSGDSAGQLKSALASLKTRLRNQIADFEAQIAAKTKTVRERAPVPEDPESVALKAQRDKLKGEFDEMFGKPELTDEQRVEMALKSLERQSKEIERQIKQGDIFPSGRKSKTPSTPEIEAAKAKRDALKEEREYLRDAIRQEVPETDSEIAAKALEQQKKSLEKQIGDLEKRIASGDTGTRGAQVNRPAVPEIEALKQQRDALSAQIAEARKKPAEQKAAEAMQKRLDAMNKAIADREARIAAGDTSAVGGPGQVNRPLAPELEQAKQRLEAVNARLAEMRKNARPRLSADAIALKSAKTRMANQIATLEDKLARRDFAPRTRRTPPADAETNRLSYELQKAKREFHEALMKDRLAQRPAYKKVLGGIGETLNTARAIQTGIDLSAVLRQGGFITFGHPIRAAKAIPDMLRAMLSAESQHRINEEINSRPNAPLYRSSKLYLSDQIGKLSQMEEAYMTRWVEKIPRAVGGGLIRGSQRAYTTFLNKLRADSFDAMADGLGRNGQLTPVEAKAIANYINKATGRGSFGGNDTANVFLNTTFFSPRYLASRFQLIAGQPLYGGTARTRIAIAKEYARFLAGVGVVYALGSMAGAKIETDPRSGEFGKMRFGNSRVDPLTGLSQITTLAGRLYTGQTKNAQGKIVQIRQSGNKKVPYGGSDTVDVLARFGRSKLSPSVGAIVDLANGKDFSQQKVTWASEAGKMLTPISVQDIYQAMQSEGVPEGTIIGLLSIFGMGVQTYDEKKKLPK